MNTAFIRGSSAALAAPQKPTVSVVIPAYNAAEFLGEALESVLAQTYQPLEVIVVDDGSEDETPQVAAAYPGRVTYVRKQRGGPGSARNAGIRAASGEWIAFQDADDIWTPGLLEKLVKVVLDTGADLVFCDSLKLINGKIVGPRRLEEYGLARRLDTLAPNGILLNSFDLLLEGFCYIYTPGVLVRREALLQVGLFDEAFYCGEDFDLWLRLSLRYRFAAVEDVLHLRRVHGTNISCNPWGRVTAGLKAYEKLERYAPTMAPNTRWRKLLRRRKAPLLREQGALYLAGGELLLARGSWTRSLRSSFSTTVAVYWLASFLPQLWVEALRNWKRRIRRLHTESNATCQEAGSLREAP